MIRKTFAAALLASVLATPALAQQGPPPSPYAPLQVGRSCSGA